jgi:hypothetical protein
MFYPTWDKSFSQHSQRCIVFGCVKIKHQIETLLFCSSVWGKPRVWGFLSTICRCVFHSFPLFIINFKFSWETMETHGKIPTISHWSVPLPPRYASQTEHEGHVLHGGILHGARWIYDKVLPHLREGPTGRAGWGREQGPKFWWRKWWFCTTKNGDFTKKMVINHEKHYVNHGKVEISRILNRQIYSCLMC